MCCILDCSKSVCECHVNWLENDVLTGWQNEDAEECWEVPVFTVLFVCFVLECGTEAEEGWETVQRGNKAKSRPSPTGGPPYKTSLPARQADADGKRTVSQLRRKEGNCRGNVAASRLTRLTAADVRKQQCSASAANVTGNSNSCTKPSAVNATQQSKSSSRVGGDRATKSGVRAMNQPVAVNSLCTETAKSETCLKTAELPAAGVLREADDKLGETNMRGSGDGRRTACSEDAADSCISTSESEYITVTQCDNCKPSVSITDLAVTHGLSSRTSSSMTEVHRSESTDVQRSPAGHLCRKSVSEDTLVQRMTVSGAGLIVVILFVISCTLYHSK